MKYLFKPFAFGLLAAVLCLPGHGQTYPTKTIRLVVPYPAGGATDYVARLFGERLSKSLGQPVMVDNKAGADVGHENSKRVIFRVIEKKL